jgi:hypothetical protein
VAQLSPSLLRSHLRILDPAQEEPTAVGRGIAPRMTDGILPHETVRGDPQAGWTRGIKAAGARESETGGGDRDARIQSPAAMGKKKRHHRRFFCVEANF